MATKNTKPTNISEELDRMLDNAPLTTTIPSYEDFITKDTLILVHYINVDGLTRQQAEQTLYEYMHINTMHSKGNVKHYILPVKNQDTKIDCINPKYIMGDEYKQLIERLETAVSDIEKQIRK